MSIMAAVQDGMVILDLEDDGPIVLVPEVSNLHLCPVEPVVVSVLEGVDVLQFDVLELSLEVVVAVRDDEVEMALNGGIDLDLLEGVVGVGVLLVVVASVMVAHLKLIIVLHDSYRYLYHTGQGKGNAGFIVCIN